MLVKTESAKILYFATMRKALFEKAVFLDRDGVINEDPGDYTWEHSKFKILQGVMESLKIWYDQGYGLIIITNQGGIAKGIYTENDVLALYQYFKGLCILNEFDIDAMYYCPHHSDIHRCLCRKPESLLIEKALHRFSLNPDKCVMIGDKQRDIASAEKAGVRGILVPSNQGLHSSLLAEYGF